MNNQTPVKERYFKKTRDTYTWTRILNTPFWAIYSLLPIFLYKDLNASSWEIACFISLKPMASLLSFYWSSLIQRRSDRLVSNVIWGGVLGHLPFLFTPWITNVWFFILASAIYMLFSRGTGPAWMEILKLNVPEESRKKVFAYSSALYHLGGAFLPLGFGWILDDYHQAWRWLFPLTALFSLTSVFLQARLPVRTSPSKEQPDQSRESGIDFITKPWKTSWNLLKERPDFAKFQLGFMLGGGALMLIQPILPMYFTTVLNLSYKELTTAFTLCKGIGYTCTLPFWTRAMSKFDIFKVINLVFIVNAAFFLGLFAAQINIIWLFIAYLIYGAMQAGSELSWNLSGPIFSRHEDSSTYSGVNVVSAGIRGCIIPSAGSLLGTFLTASPIILFGGGVCLLATWSMSRISSKLQVSSEALEARSNAS